MFILVQRNLYIIIIKNLLPKKLHFHYGIKYKKILITVFIFLFDICNFK
jgi:hypothetical protein